VSDLVRFSVSLEADLLERFDRYCEDQHFATRSEAIRQLLRESLTGQAWGAGNGDAVATLTLVYDHHRPQLADRLLELQHAHVESIVSTLHVHLDKGLCLEVIVLRGKAAAIGDIAASIRGLKGIVRGQLVVASAEHATEASD